MKNMTKQGGATYGPDGQSSTLPCRAWGLTPEARDCKVIIVVFLANADADASVNACMDGRILSHLNICEGTIWTCWGWLTVQL